MQPPLARDHCAGSWTTPSAQAPQSRQIALQPPQVVLEASLLAPRASRGMSIGRRRGKIEDRGHGTDPPAAAGRGGKSMFVPLDRAKFRTIALRQQ